MITRQRITLRPCTKKALFICLNYESSNNFNNSNSSNSKKQLEAIDAIQSIKSTFKIKLHFADIRLLNNPTKNEILENFTWLLNETQSGDVLVLHICGLGNENGLMPIDYEISGCISHAMLHEHLIDHLPQNINFWCVLDYPQNKFIGLRYQIIDKSSGSFENVKKITNSLKDCDLNVKEKIEIEKTDIAETWGSIIILTSQNALNGYELTICFNYILNHYYLHTMTFENVLSKLKSLLQMNFSNNNNKVSFECGKLIDMHANFGRFIFAPI